MRISAIARTLPAVFLAILASACGGGAEAGAGGDAEQYVLRLTDLPRGMRLSDELACGQLGLEGASGALAELVLAERPRSCSADFDRSWGSGPARVDSAVWLLASEQGVRRAFRLRRDVIEWMLGERGLRAGGQQPALGDEAELLTTENGFAAGQTDRPVAIVVWRAGSVLSLVLVGRTAGAPPEQEAFELARVQHERIVSPTPVGPSDNDDREVALDHPRITIPIHWLGRTFEPAGLPPLDLFQSNAPLGEDAGSEVRIEYYTEGLRDGVSLDLWRPAKWQRFLRTRVGRLARDPVCTVRRRVRISGGRAFVFGGYRRVRGRPCPARPFDDVYAHVYFRRAVVAVNMPLCLICGPDPRPPRPYRTVRGITAAVVGLRARE